MSELETFYNWLASSDSFARRSCDGELGGEEKWLIYSENGVVMNRVRLL